MLCLISLVGQEHVPRYHEWMKDHDLLEATGSEPLTLEEEIAMQISWRDDPKKCTFIVHSAEGMRGGANDTFDVGQHLETMVGDVNLFLSESDDDSIDGEDRGSDDAPDSGEALHSESDPRIQAEIDIMIADKQSQNKGMGRAATCTMLLYGTRMLGVKRFFCKINEDNKASLSLFKSLGFEQCDYAACFRQIELELKAPLANMQQELLETFGSYEEMVCPLTGEEL